MGRDFLKRFKTTEFDWEKSRVRLGECWIFTEPSLWGGQALSRAGAVKRVLKESGSIHGKRWEINPELSTIQREAIESVLDEYPDVFASNPKRPNTTFLMKHGIETGDALPVKARHTRVSPWAEQEINNQIKQMLENGVICPSNSPWASRVILVKKKDGTIRFAVDYRALNDLTKKDSYPIPEMKDILDKLHGSEYSSTLDGANCGERQREDGICLA